VGAITLEELEKERIKSLSDKLLCPNNSCETKGQFQRCYIHTFVYCPRFELFYNTLTYEQKVDL